MDGNNKVSLIKSHAQGFRAASPVRDAIKSLSVQAISYAHLGEFHSIILKSETDISALCFIDVKQETSA